MTERMDTARYEGTDYICSNCGCEIMVKHSGDASKMRPDSTYTCRCGTAMQLEHPPAEGAAGAAP
jgi:DNA-directed RNA polymerase subunit RPC12/RpoP